MSQMITHFTLSLHFVLDCLVYVYVRMVGVSQEHLWKNMELWVVTQLIAENKNNSFGTALMFVCTVDATSIV